MNRFTSELTKAGQFEQPRIAAEAITHLHEAFILLIQR